MRDPSWLCAAEQSQLIIIDVQERLAGAMPPEAMTAVEKQIGTLVTAATALAIPVIHTEQYPQGLGHTLPSLREQLAQPLEKTCFACTGAEGFNQHIQRNRRQVILCGIEAHICVLQTAIELLGQGFQVFVVEDGVCSRKDSNRRNALDRLWQAGAHISNTESVLFEWLRDASHPDFRTLSKLIR